MGVIQHQLHTFKKYTGLPLASLTEYPSPIGHDIKMTVPDSWGGQNITYPDPYPECAHILKKKLNFGQKWLRYEQKSLAIQKIHAPFTLRLQ